MSSSQEIKNQGIAQPFEPLVQESDLKSAKFHLKSPKITHDCSSPNIERGVHIHQNHHTELLAELHQPHHLKHTETQDKSAPLIDSSIHINQNHFKEVFAEIQQPHHLKHTETHDKSAPVIESDVHIHKSAQLRLKENVSWAKDKIVENVEYAKEMIAEKIGMATEGLRDSAHMAKEKVAENVEQAKEGLKENAEAAKEKLAHNATVAKVKMSKRQARGGVPVPPPSQPEEHHILPPQPTDKPHHEQAFTEKIVNQEAKLHAPATNVKGQIPIAPENPPVETQQEHQKAFTKQIGKAKLHKGDVPLPPEKNTFSNPQEQPHEKAFTEQIVEKASPVAKAMPGEQTSSQLKPVTLE